MSYVTASRLTRRYDLSDPWFIRMIAGRKANVLTAVNQVSFSIEKGTTYALVGESGSGKSTIAKMLAGVLTPSQGSIKLTDKISIIPGWIMPTKNYCANAFRWCFSRLTQALIPLENWRYSA